MSIEGSCRIYTNPVLTQRGLNKTVAIKWGGAGRLHSPQLIKENVMAQVGNLNYSTQKVLMEIDNDPVLVTKIKNGLLLAVCRFIGFKPRGSSHPFITCYAPAHQQRRGVTIENTEKKLRLQAKGMDYESTFTFTVSAETKFSYFVLSAKLHDGDDHYSSSEVDEDAILAHLVSKHWPEALDAALTRYRKAA